MKKQQINMHDPLIKRTHFLGSFFEDNHYNDYYLSEDLGGNKKEEVIHSMEEERFNTDEGINALKALLDGTTSTDNLTMDNQENGNIVLSLNFEEHENGRMLKPKQVCNMLQISNYLLRKLVKQGKVRSHKFGRIRRFALQDVIGFLDNSKNAVISADSRENMH